MPASAASVSLAPSLARPSVLEGVGSWGFPGSHQPLGRVSLLILASRFAQVRTAAVGAVAQASPIHGDTRRTYSAVKSGDARCSSIPRTISNSTDRVRPSVVSAHGLFLKFRATQEAAPLIGAGYDISRSTAPTLKKTGE